MDTNNHSGMDLPATTCAQANAYVSRILLA